MHKSVEDFVTTILAPRDIKDKRVLEVGALNINGSIRSHIEAQHPSEYMGIDIQQGAGVDCVIDAGNLIDTFGPESYDLVLCLEMLEHCQDWRRVIHNLKGVLKTGGILIATTRSPGFPLHNEPDHWRYTINQWYAIWVDMDWRGCGLDPQVPGVMVCARKQEGYRERDLGWLEVERVAPE